MADSFTLLGSEKVPLDPFQQTLLQMTKHASARALSKFFSKNYRPLYQFMLQLYLTSLTREHPDRGHTSKYRQEDGYTVKEHKILSEFANLLTDDEPLHKGNELQTNQPTVHINAPNINRTTNSTQHCQHRSPSTSPKIDASNTYTSKPNVVFAKVDDKHSKKHQKRMNKYHEHSQSVQQLSHPLSVLHSGPISSNRNRTKFAAYPRAGKQNSVPTPKKRGVSFASDIEQKTSQNDLKLSPTENKPHRAKTRRGSIWEGVLDVNNVIMVPEAPKWRPRFSFQPNQLLQEGLLNSILATIVPEAQPTGSNPLGLHNEVELTSVSALCLYLPLLLVVSSTLPTQKLKNELQRAILERSMAEVDAKQQIEFFLHSYKDAHKLIKEVRSNTVFTSEWLRSLDVDDAATTPMRMGRAQSVDTGKRSSKKPQNIKRIIVQKTVESAISLFESLLREPLEAGTEIKLCRESLVRDPINCHAPPLSRIEMRKVIASASKPYLIDLYVSNRRDNFEYLSCTVILKKGDDLRRDCATLNVFRLMNKVWREKGLEFTNVPVNAFTYKCVAMSADFGVIELIEGCKPLRLVSALEDTITMGQQFNLIASAAGSYVASYVMGVRDRHFDNVLIRDNDCTLFHIDFGFVLGDTASVDTSKFAITADLKKLMGAYWDQFVELGVQAFLALRQKYKYLVKYARVAFEYLEKPDMVQDFIKYQLHVDDMTDYQAAKYIARKLKESPDSVKTKFKNAVHQLAGIKK
eukprot:1025801_1